MKQYWFPKQPPYRPTRDDVLRALAAAEWEKRRYSKVATTNEVKK